MHDTSGALDRVPAQRRAHRRRHLRARDHRRTRPPEPPSARGPGGRRIASVREREELRRGAPHSCRASGSFVAATPGFETLGTGIVHGLLAAGADAVLDTDWRRRLGRSPPRPTATPPTCSWRSGPGDAPGVPVQLLRVGPLPVRGRRTAWPTAIRQELEPLLGDGRGVLRPRLRGAPRDADGGRDLRAGGRRRRRRRAPSRHPRARAGAGPSSQASSAGSAASTA